MKFKAAVLTESNKPLVIEELELPVLKAGQVLVKLDSSGVCGAQINEIDAIKGKDNFLPHLLGHEGHGEVLEIGEGVRYVKHGDKVVMHWRRGKGIESETPKYLSKHHGLINAGWITTFNEYAVVSENRLTAIPSYVNQDCASLMGCAVTTAMGTLSNDAKIKVGESIAIFGCGGVGLSLIQFARLSGCFPIIGVDIHENRLKHALTLGATHIIQSDNENFGNQILEFNNNSKIDVCLDNTGLPEIIETAYSLTSNEGGRTVLIGVMSNKSKLNICTYPLHFNQDIIGSSGGQSIPNIDIPRIIKLIDNNLLNINALIGKTYNFEEINIAIDELRNGKISGRLIIQM